MSSLESAALAYAAAKADLKPVQAKLDTFDAKVAGCNNAYRGGSKWPIYYGGIEFEMTDDIVNYLRSQLLDDLKVASQAVNVAAVTLLKTAKSKYRNQSNDE